MIQLDASSVSTEQHTFGGQVISSITTDALFVSNVSLDFTTGAIYATLSRGTLVNGTFQANYPDLHITVNPDGSFVSDGAWNGTVPSAPLLVAELKSQFDLMLLSTGLVQGTQI
jgi:hypothetical protein